MGGIFAIRVLVGILERPAPPPPEVMPEPIRPGAWAEWARADAAAPDPGSLQTPARPVPNRVPDPWTPRLAPGPHHG